jgi:glutathione S-transferase
MAAELNLDYAHVPLEFDDPALKEPEFLALNPAGAVPTIVDDGFPLSESLAINLYLARKYGSIGQNPLYPATPEQQADAWRWSLWAQGHLEPWIQRDRLLADVIAVMGRHAEGMINHSLDTLNQALSGRRWLIDDHFTVADLNLAGVLSPSRANGLDLTGYPDLRRWLDACYARPTARAVRQRYQP